jgi:hypothetical protein
LSKQISLKIKLKKMKKLLFSIIECNEITYKIKFDQDGEIIFLNFIYEPNDLDEAMAIDNDPNLIRFLKIEQVDINKLDADQTVYLFNKYINIRELF